VKSYKFVCHSCGTKATIDSEANAIMAAKEISWGSVFDTSNGLTSVHYCPDCFDKAQKLAKDLQNIIKLENFHFDCLTE
jgi:hypothetical protein